MTNTARAQISAYLEAHPRGKEGQVVYDVRKDFSAEPTELRAPFDFYRERFAIREEVQ